MKPLYEYTDRLNNPCECFVCSNSLHSLPVAPHFHYFIEILYIKEGSLLVYHGNESHVLTEGDMILFLPSMVHAIYTTSNAPYCYQVLKFDPAPFGSSLNFSALFAAANNVWNNKRDTDNVPFLRIFFPSEMLQALPIASLFSTCIAEMSEKQYGYQTLLHAKIQELSTYILRIWRIDGFDTDTLFTPASQYESIYSITEFIDQHLGENLRVEALARQCNMSYSHFAKNFREVYGQSCKKYIESLRLSKVEDMLRFTNFDLNVISQETGFSDCSHLIHAFKEKYDITPHQYRLIHHI